MRKIALPKRTVLLPGAAVLVIALAVAGILALQGWRGKGTREDPYLISGKADLQRLGRDVKNDIRYEGQYFELTQYIDLNGEA